MEKYEVDPHIILHDLRLLISNGAGHFDKDFILVIGHYRFEYHSEKQVFVIENRLFDTVELDPNKLEQDDEPEEQAQFTEHGIKFTKPETVKT